MNKDTIEVNDGGVVVTGKVKGNITTNAKEKKPTSDAPPKNSKINKVPIIAAVIAALGAMVSGFLIAASNFFGG